MPREIRARLDRLRAELEDAQARGKAPRTLRKEIRAQIGSLRRQLRAQIKSARDEIRTELRSARKELRKQLKSVRREIKAQVKVAAAHQVKRSKQAAVPNSQHKRVGTHAWNPGKKIEKTMEKNLKGFEKKATNWLKSFAPKAGSFGWQAKPHKHAKPHRAYGKAGKWNG